MGTEPTIAEQLADYVTATKLADLPAPVIEKTKQVILDTIGCMVAGSRDRVGEISTGYALRHGAPGRATVFGRAGRVDPEHAALGNGTAAHVLEMDDGHRPSDNHLGGVVVPAAIAMAQHIDKPGKDLLLSVTLGYDVMGRVGEAVMLPRIRSPFHHTGTTGVFGAAAAVGKLLGFDREHMTNAFGVAGDGASSLKEFQSPPFTGLDCKPLHSGRAAQTGMIAALLAADGFEGSTTIFEGPKGFVTVFSPQPRPELICRDLGERFAVVESGFKIHSCPGGAHAVAVDAALALRKEHALEHRAIKRIRLGLPSWTKDPGFERLRFTRPDTLGTARFSYPFVVALALCDGELTYRNMTEQRLVDPDVVRLRDLVEFVDDPEVQHISDTLTREDPYYYAPALLEIEAGKGTYRRLERTPLGYDPKRALTRAQVIDKFRYMVDGILSPEGVQRVIDWAFDLDGGAKARDLGTIL